MQHIFKTDMLYSNYTVTVIMFNLQVMMCCNLGYNAATG